VGLGIPKYAPACLTDRAEFPHGFVVGTMKPKTVVITACTCGGLDDWADYF
jgi:hypothetical protein